MEDKDVVVLSEAVVDLSDAQQAEITQADRIQEFRNKRKQSAGAKVEESSSNMQWEYDQISFMTVLPTPRIDQESELIHATTFRSILKTGQTEAQIIEEAKSSGYMKLLEEKYDGELEQIQTELREELGEMSTQLEGLAPAGTDIAAVKANNESLWERIHELADEMKKVRDRLMEIGNDLGDLTMGSAEHQADFSRTAYLMSKCTQFVEIGESVWETPDDFLDEQDSTLVMLARMQYSMVKFGVKSNADLDELFVENRVLRVAKGEEDDENTVPQESTEE